MKIRVLLSVVVIVITFAGPSLFAKDKDIYKEKRDEMVRKQIVDRGVRDKAVIGAMKSVERHLFVPEDLQNYAYDDGPLPIGEGQTISQPYIVAFMTETAKIKPTDSVLEIGTGSGYQAAVLAGLAKSVYSIEILEDLAESARQRLEKLGYKNVFVKHGDGYRGWPEKAPFDAIVVTAAPTDVPEALLEQLKVGGRMVLPVGRHFQELLSITKTKDGIEKERLLPVRFVPMVHE